MESHSSLQLLPHRVFRFLTILFSCMDVKQMAKHMILAEETTNTLETMKVFLNVQLMTKLLQVVAYNLAKSRMA